MAFERYVVSNVASGIITIVPTARDIGEKVWANFLTIDGNAKSIAQVKAKDKWGVTPKDWYIYRSKSMKPYSKIYGYLYLSASRHTLSPEFLHSVLMGEGLNLLIEEFRSSSTPYKDDTEIDSYHYLGADEIGTTIDSLIADGYIEKAHKNNIRPKPVVNELGEHKVSGIVTGFETAIEVVAAELHQRRDWVVEYVSKHNLKVDTTDSDVIDFLNYAFYNNPSVGMDAAKNLAHYMRRYSGNERDDQINVRYNTLVRLATADWYKLAGPYDF